MEATVATALVSRKGWIVIPAEYRARYSIKPGDHVRIVDYGGVLALVPGMADAVQQAAGMLKGEKSLTAALLDERATERARE
jgi:AbrB family looped-hinge helix DNA binding protein